MSGKGDAKAIKAVYPHADIQLDYFHILQNIWREVWDDQVARIAQLLATGN